MTNIAILASGNGTNAEHIALTFEGSREINISIVLTNRAEAGVIGRMKRLGIEVEHIPDNVWRENPGEIVGLLRRNKVDLIVLAGFLKYIDPVIIEAFPKRILNIHPSLLPAYGGPGMYGARIHRAVVEAGEKRSGVTVHFVSAEIDGGDIILQKSIELSTGETAESLEAKIHPLEYELYPEAISRVARGLCIPY